MTSTIAGNPGMMRIDLSAPSSSSKRRKKPFIEFTSLYFDNEKNTVKYGFKDGLLSSAQFQCPHIILIDRDNNLVVSDDPFIQLINLQTQQVQTILGNGQYMLRYFRNPLRGYRSILFGILL